MKNNDLKMAGIRDDEAELLFKLKQVFENNSDLKDNWQSNPEAFVAECTKSGLFTIDELLYLQKVYCKPKLRILFQKLIQKLKNLLKK